MNAAISEGCKESGWEIGPVQDPAKALISRRSQLWYRLVWAKGQVGWFCPGNWISCIDNEDCLFGAIWEIWEGTELGAKFHIEPIPADLAEQAKEYRQLLLDTALSVDDAAMEEYFDKGDVAVETLKRCIKASTIPPARSVRCCAAPRSRTRACSRCWMRPA